MTRLTVLAVKDVNWKTIHTGEYRLISKSELGLKGHISLTVNIIRNDWQVDWYVECG